MNGHEFFSKSSSYEPDSQILELGERERIREVERKESKWMKERMLVVSRSGLMHERRREG